jgi:hypothetical protein
VALIALAETKTWLGVSGSDDDALLTALIARVVAFLQVQTGRYFGESDSHTEYLPGTGTADLWLNEPADDITSVHERSYAGETWSEITEGDDDGFELRGRRLLRKGWASWSRDREYRVIYEFGYATGPEDVRQLALDLVSLKYSEHDTASEAASDLKSFQIGDTRWEKAIGADDASLARIPWVAETLAHWRGLRRGVA